MSSNRKSQLGVASLIGLLLAPGCDALLWDVPTGYGDTDTDGDFSYHIQENVEYEEYDCFSTHVDEITKKFQDELDPKFQGQRVFDGSPDCFSFGIGCPLGSHVAESSQSFGITTGKDDAYADSAAIFLFAGHGGSATPAGPVLSYTRLDPGNPPQACDPQFHNHIRLGRLGGGKTRLGIYAASCVGAGNWWGSVAQITQAWDLSFGNSLTWQHLAFLDSPELVDAELKDFARQVQIGEDHNISAWLYYTRESHDGETLNQPVVITRGVYEETTQEIVDRANLANFYTMNKLPAPEGATDLVIADDDSWLNDGLHDNIPSSCDFY